MSNKKSNNKPDDLGFGRFDPGKEISKYRSKNPIIEQWHQFILDSGPYWAFGTVTFRNNMPLRHCFNYVNQLAKRLNLLIYKNRYRKGKKEYMKGFAVIEEHKLGNSNNPFHVHLLIRNDDTVCNVSLAKYKQHLCKAARNIRDLHENKVFSGKCLDIREFGDDFRVLYSLKQVYAGNVTRVKLLGKDGLSDSDI